VVAVRWQQHIFCAHGAGDPNANRFLTKRGSEGAERTSSLQRYRLRVKQPRPPACCTESGRAIGNASYCREVWFRCRIKQRCLPSSYPSGEAASDKLGGV